MNETPQCVECTPGYELTDTDLDANQICLDCHIEDLQAEQY